MFSISEQLQESEHEAIKALSSLHATSADRLAADDRVLEALSSVSTKAISTPTVNINHAELEQWLQALAVLRAGQVRARVASMLAGAGPEFQEDLSSEGAELWTELETLKDEIDSVVHMVIGHELRNPLMKSLEATEKGSRAGNRTWSHYLLSTFEYLVKQLDIASTRIIDLRQYTDALLELRSMIITTKSESCQTSDTSFARPPLSAKSLEVPPKSAASSAPQTPTSSLPAALRRLNLAPDTQPLALTALSHDAHSKLRTQYASLEKAFIDTLGKSLAPQQQDTLAILGQLHSHSRFGSIKLSDEGLEKKVTDLGKRIDELAPKVAGGDLR